MAEDKKSSGSQNKPAQQGNKSSNPYPTPAPSPTPMAMDSKQNLKKT